MPNHRKMNAIILFRVLTAVIMSPTIPPLLAHIYTQCYYRTGILKANDHQKSAYICIHVYMYTCIFFNNVFVF